MHATAGRNSYLVRGDAAWCFRMIVPAELRELVGRRELRYSLRTGSLAAARRKARLIAGRIQLLFHRIRTPRSAP